MGRVAPILLLVGFLWACDPGSPIPPPTIRCDALVPECDAAESVVCLDPCRARADVAQLSAPAMEGRGTGFAGNEAAAEWIGDRFAALGLEQVPGLGGWRQVFPVHVEGAPSDLAPNVLGVIPGTDPALLHEVVMVGAHLDHLGGTAGGTIYPGADDDASGVAVVLELARAFAQSATRPRRTLLFAAWNAEELGLLGSCYYAEHDPLFPLGDTVAAIAVDMVGQGNERGLDLYGSSARPAPEIIAVARGAARAAGIELAVGAPGVSDGSDHLCFAEQGVPAVQAMTPGPHRGYHSSLDTVDLIGSENLRAALELVFVTAQAYAQGQDAAWAPLAGAPPEATGEPVPRSAP